MSLFDTFKSKNNYEKNLSEKIELKDKIIIKLENDLDSKNKEIKLKEVEIDNLKAEIEKLKTELYNNIHVQDDSSNSNFIEEKSQKFEQVKGKESSYDSSDINQLRERLISKIKEKTKIKSYHIDYEEITDGDIFMSKFGGLGYWDTSMEYPKDDNGNQLILLAQINFEQEKFDDSNLPISGLLQFYILPDEVYGMARNDTFRVVYHEKVNYDIKKEDLSNIKTNLMLNCDNFPVNGECKITFTETEDYINSSNWNFREIVNDIVKEEFNIDVSKVSLYKVFGEGIMEYIDEKFLTSGSKLLGYPYFTQTDPREGKKFRDYNILLFQMDSEGPIMWGDLGVANFFIKDNNNFSEVFYTWDCS